MVWICIVAGLLMFIFGGFATYITIKSSSEGDVKNLFVSFVFAVLFFVAGASGFVLANEIQQNKIQNTPSIVYTVYRVDELDGPRGGFKQVWLESGGKYIWILIEDNQDSSKFRSGQIVSFTPNEWDEYIKSIKGE